jgi:hypothetical protein
MRPRPPSAWKRVVLLALAAPLAACADRNPAAVEPGIPPPEALAVLTCTAQVRAATVTCRGGSPLSGGALGDLIVGRPYVDLESGNVAYAADTFRFDVTLQNLMPQPIGTNDGTTVAPQGIRVFFHSGPTTTQGPGSIEVANEDGTAAFTAADQPYFRYDTLLATGETSAPKEWRFTVPPTVATFQFVLYVSVPVPSETGTLDVYPGAPQLLVGGQLPLLGVVRGAAGGIARGAPITWTSSDTTVVAVDSNGVVTGLSLGDATITATSGARVDAVTVSVSTSDTQGPSLLDFRLSLDSVDLSTGADSVVVELALADGGVGVEMISVFLLNGSSGGSCTPSLSDGNIQRGTWLCSITLAPFVDNGRFNALVVVTDQLNNQSGYDADSLAARGFDSGVEVTGSTPDGTGPQLTAFAFSPDSVNVDTASATINFSVTATDAGTGVIGVSFSLNSPTETRSRTCVATRTGGTAASGTWTCSVELAEDIEGGTWSVSGMRLQDLAGNINELPEPELRLLGFPTEVEVVSPNADVTAPTFDAFAVTPDSVDIAAGPATVTFSITASDAGSGVTGTVTYLSSPSGSLILFCSGELQSGTAASGTWTCSVTIPQFAETGEWRILSASAGDGPGNGVALTTAELETAGFPFKVVVTN